MTEPLPTRSERFFGCPKHGPVTNHANDCWCGRKPQWWVPEAELVRLRGMEDRLLRLQDGVKALRHEASSS